jgi:hypothetical protein
MSPPLWFDGVMTQPGFIHSDERIVDTMIGLACAAKSHRIILAGSNSFEMFVDLHRRGYLRVTTTRICHVPCGQHDVAFITWPGSSFGVLEATLDRLVHFLSAAGVLVMWIGPRQMSGRALRVALKKFGFRIEAGTRCEGGVAISARRIEASPLASAA